MTMGETYVDRLLIERDDLNERLNKFRKFIESKKLLK